MWDLAALDILVREAGGTLMGLEGTAGPHRDSAAAPGPASATGADKA